MTVISQAGKFYAWDDRRLMKLSSPVSADSALKSGVVTLRYF
jgi:hypothetical protein